MFLLLWLNVSVFLWDKNILYLFGEFIAFHDFRSVLLQNLDGITFFPSQISNHCSCSMI